LNRIPLELNSKKELYSPPKKAYSYNSNFLKKLKDIEEARTRIIEYTNDIKTFVDSNQDLIQSYKLMI
jgi:hypothetical protein